VTSFIVIISLLCALEEGSMPLNDAIGIN